jgi:hypothetical protein
MKISCWVYKWKKKWISKEENCIVKHIKYDDLLEKGCCSDFHFAVQVQIYVHFFFRLLFWWWSSDWTLNYNNFFLFCVTSTWNFFARKLFKWSSKFAIIFKKLDYNRVWGHKAEKQWTENDTQNKTTTFEGVQRFHSCCS